MDYTNYFGITAILSAFVWLILLSIVVLIKASFFKIKRDRNLYVLNFYFKIALAITYGCYYILIVGGGDTSAYWDGAVSIQNLLQQDFVKGVQHLFSEATPQDYYYYFNNETGFPPGWIYRESESYFVSRIAAVIGLFTFKSYFATTFVFTYIVAHANWKIYEIIKDSKVFTSKYIHLAVFFIPSLSFWCSGISKDTLMVICIFYSFYFLYQLFIKGIIKIKYIVGVIFFCWMIFSIRDFMIIAILLPLVVTISNHFHQKLNLAPIILFPLNLMYVGVIIVGMIYFIQSQGANSLIAENAYVKQAMIIQDDFKNNETYGKNQYSLGEIDNTAVGIVKAIPNAIFSGIFEPLPWNGLSLSLFLNALESTILLFLFLRLFITGKIISWFQQLQQTKIILFFLVFIFFIAFITGFTSVIFGVLVRLRAPILPFVFLILLNQYSSSKNAEKLN